MCAARVSQGSDLPELTVKERAFADAYVLTGKKGASAILAGYSPNGATQAARRILKKAHVAAYVDVRRAGVVAKIEAAFDISADRILRELSYIAFLDPRKMFDANGNLLNVQDMSEETARAIAGLDVLEQYAPDGTYTGMMKKLRLGNKIAALELLGKHQKLWNDDPKNQANILNIIIDTTSNQLDQPDKPKVIEHETKRIF